MARRQRLNETQIAELFDPPTEQRELVRHFTLSEGDLVAIRRCRGDHNRLGHALMRCYLRYPGRALRIGERPPAALLAFVAEQIGALSGSIDEYLAAERNRQRHAIECQEQLGLRPPDPRQRTRRNRGSLGIRFTGRSGSGFQPAMVRAHARACALSVMPGNSRRSSTAAANSPRCS